MLQPRRATATASAMNSANAPQPAFTSSGAGTLSAPFTSSGRRRISGFMGSFSQVVPQVGVSGGQVGAVTDAREQVVLGQLGLAPAS